MNRWRLKAQPLVEDFAAIAVERERKRHERSGVNLVHGPFNDLHIKIEFGTVQVFEEQRNARRDGQGREVSVASPAKSDDMKLKTRPSKSREQNVQMEKAPVVNLTMHVRPIPKGSHAPSVLITISVGGTE